MKGRFCINNVLFVALWIVNSKKNSLFYVFRICLCSKMRNHGKKEA